MATAPALDFSDLVEGVITTIPLDRLMLSTLNVRQTERNADVDSLAEDIAARGLKQNLVVVPAHYTSGEASELQRETCKPAPGGTGPWQDRFEVIAGGRRLQAMQLLVQQDRLSPTTPVPCMVEFRDEASETSLSENLHRVAMNPADEFEAYRIIVDGARKNGVAEDPIAYCAKRFGVAVKHVQGRLRLASLAPDILAALKADEIGVESAKAYATVEDHELQLKVFRAQEKSNWQKHAATQVRSALRSETLPLDSTLAKFVGLVAYSAAGGRIESEMFMGAEGQERITDVKLLEKLAREQADAMLPAAVKRDGFKSGVLAKGVGPYVNVPKPPEGMAQYPAYRDAPTKAQKKKMIGVYSISNEGDGIASMAMFFTPPPVKAEEPRDWDAERRERARDLAIERLAGQMAVQDIGAFTGTPLEGLVFWPTTGGPFSEDDAEHALVTVYIRVPVESINAHKVEAERQIDEEASAAEAAKAEVSANDEA